MKKLIIGMFMVIAVYACGGGGEKAKDSGSETTEPEKADITANPDYKKGLALIAKSDCLTCHKVDEKLTGPAYRDVANKYPNDQNTIDTLASKVVKGGSGNWGTVPMTPHAKISLDDAKQMVKYVLLLKNK